MEIPSIELMEGKILLTRRSTHSDYHARLKSNPAKWGCGASPDAAVGSLVLSWPDDFIAARPAREAHATLRGEAQAAGAVERWVTPDGYTKLPQHMADEYGGTHVWFLPFADKTDSGHHWTAWPEDLLTEALGGQTAAAARTEALLPPKARGPWTERNDGLVDRQEAMSEAIRMVSDHADFLTKCNRHKAAGELNMLLMDMQKRALTLPAANPDSAAATFARLVEECRRAVLSDSPTVGTIAVKYEPAAGEAFDAGCRAATAIAKRLGQPIEFEFNDTTVEVTEASVVRETHRLWLASRGQ